MSKPIPHGTTNGYSNYGCRCDACRQANTDAARARRRRDGMPSKAEDNARRRRDMRHGSAGWYKIGCRCEPCRRWARESRRRHRPTDRECPACGARVNGERGLQIHVARGGCQT